MGLAGVGLGMGIPGAVDVSRTTETKLSQILDVYLLDHTLLRINSDRVSFDVLGKDRGFSATENVDKVAVLLGSQAPQALVDTGFGRFRPPANLGVNTTLGGMGNTPTVQHDESGSFDFYSGWIYTINRGLAGRRPPS